QHYEVPVFHQGIRQVEAADAEIYDTNIAGQFPLRQAVDHLHTKGIVAKKDVADASYQHLTAHASPRRSTLKAQLLREKKRNDARVAAACRDRARDRLPARRPGVPGRRNLVRWPQ